MIPLFSVFNATLSPMLVMFLCMAIGFVLNKLRLLPENGATVISKLENYAIVPALNIYTLMNHCTPQSLSAQGIPMLVAGGVTVTGVLLSYPLSGLLEKDSCRKNLYRYALTFGNYGFMGNAIVPAILGEEALYRYMIFCLPLLVVAYTWGMMMLIPSGNRQSGRDVLKRFLNPSLISTAAGIVLGLTGAKEFLPAFFKTTLQNLSACMGPLAMILTGFVVGSYSISVLLKNKLVYGAAALRLLVLPAIFVGFLMLLGVDKNTLALTLFAFATPLGLNTVVIPAAYGGDPSTGASMAMISHTACVVTIPLMYALFTAVLNLI